MGATTAVRRRRSSGVRVLAVVCSLAVPAASQIYGTGRDGVLAPTVDVTLDTTANGGVFEFTSIHVPAGVTVRITGPHAAQLLCRGTATIQGGIDADGRGSYWAGGVYQSGWLGGPGGYRGGSTGQPGDGPGGGAYGLGIYPAIGGGSGSHATAGATNNPFLNPAPTYGSALPFDLRGGSGGGAPGTGTGSGIGPPASGGGGTVVILAEGAIDVAGSISARGGDQVLGLEYMWPNYPVQIGGLGSGGSILLRSLQCVRVSGLLDARAGSRHFAWQVPSTGGLGDGFVRIDAYSACGAPDLTGATIHPAPFVASLPFLGALEEARVGQTYRVRCASAPGDVVGFYYSVGTGFLPVPPFGVLLLDPTRILAYGLHTVPATGHDPLASIDIPVPFAPSLVGCTFHAQTFNAFGATTGQARLSNRLTTTLGP